MLFKKFFELLFSQESINHFEDYIFFVFIQQSNQFYLFSEAFISYSYFFRYIPVKINKLITRTGYKKIEDIRVGDWVWSHNEKTGRQELKRVTKVFVRQTQKLINLYFGNEIIQTTPDHPFYLAGKWVKSGNLSQGDSLHLFRSRRLALDSLVKVDTNARVYNFSVAKHHNYFVGKAGVLVHNANGYDLFDEAANQLNSMANRFKWRGKKLQQAINNLNNEEIPLTLRTSVAQKIVENDFIGVSGYDDLISKLAMKKNIQAEVIPAYHSFVQVTTDTKQFINKGKTLQFEVNTPDGDLDFVMRNFDNLGTDHAIQYKSFGVLTNTLKKVKKAIGQVKEATKVGTYYREVKLEFRNHTLSDLQKLDSYGDSYYKNIQGLKNDPGYSGVVIKIRTKDSITYDIVE
ncbi:intein C-terminal splicing region domain protein [Microscilla marina ATCC 23134]|uniref:Intein C-terminal splicing region domain protein n=2 Tax=Microscilla marina TaxID=1027 RepID=A1ZEK3_MICM2|nr:intein C-terminal splicing region domain protein [Microscilla marina ATCC 23134]